MWKKVEFLEGEQAMEFAAAVIDPLCEIANDKEAADIFYTHKLPDGADRVQYTESIMRQCIPLLLKNHRESLVKIFALNQGKTEAEYSAKANLLTMSADLAGMIDDVGLRLSFGFAQPRLTQSGSAPENTEG